MRRWLTLLAAAALAAGSSIGTPPAALAAPGVTAAASPSVTGVVAGCVKRRTGALRILSSPTKACRKGEKRITWNEAAAAGPAGPVGPAGPTGPTGPAGQPLSVKAADGTTIGLLMGIFPLSNIPIFQVLRDGGLYLYLNDGSLMAGLYGMGSTTQVKFTDNACAGTPQHYTTVASTPFNIGLALQGYGRLVTRTDAGVYATYQILAQAGTAIAAPTQLYARDGAGVCAVSGVPVDSGTLWNLTAVTTPPSFTGPLTVG